MHRADLSIFDKTAKSPQGSRPNSSKNWIEDPLTDTTVEASSPRPLVIMADYDGQICGLCTSWTMSNKLTASTVILVPLAILIAILVDSVHYIDEGNVGIYFKQGALMVFNFFFFNIGSFSIFMNIFRMIHIPAVYLLNYLQSE